MGCLCDWQIERDVVIQPFQKEQLSKGVISSGLSSMGYDIRVGYKFRLFTNNNATEVDPKNFDERAFFDKDLTPKQHNWTGPTRDLNKPNPDKRLGGEPIWQCTNCKTWTHYPEEKDFCPTPNYVHIPPNSFALAESLEYIEIPSDCIGICLGKSTLHRCGIIVSCTPLEPSWKGKITIEIGNSTPLPARVYAGEGIMQVIFLRSDGYRERLDQAINRLLGPALRADLPTAGGLLWDIEEEYKSTQVSCTTSYAKRKGKYQDQKGLTIATVEKETP